MVHLGRGPGEFLSPAEWRGGAAADSAVGVILPPSSAFRDRNIARATVTQVSAIYSSAEKTSVHACMHLYLYSHMQEHRHGALGHKATKPNLNLMHGIAEPQNRKTYVPRRIGPGTA